jgi:hypothetical protein
VSPTGALVDPDSLDGNEIKLLGAGAANIQTTTDGFIIGAIQRISGSTYRYYVQPKAGVDVADTFIDGEVSVQIVQNSFTVGTGASAVNNVRSDATFSVDGTVQSGASGDDPIELGPLTLQGPSISLAKTEFKGGKLVLSIAIGVNSAGLAFGGGGGNGDSGITAELTGLLGTFDITIDILAALSAVTEGGNIFDAFDVPGKFRIDIAGLNIEIPNVLVVTGSGIVINYDPNYDAAENGGLPQELVIVQSALITFPRFGVTGAILPSGTTPGLTVYDNGFAIGEAMLIYDPDGGAIPPTSGSGAPQSELSQTGGATGSALSFGDILEFDDLRIGVSNFRVTFDGSDAGFSGTIFIASGGARFLPGRPVSATLSDRVTAEPDIAPGIPDTEAVRASLEFEAGRVKGFIFEIDTFTITLGSFVTIFGQSFFLDTGAEGDEELVSFQALGAEVTIGSLKLSGEARNFAFLGDGSFVTKPGFGIFLEIGSADGSSFAWPEFLPIKISQIGIVWPDINADPSDFQLILSASITGLQGVDGLKFEGTVEGIVIDIGLLKQGKFPITDIRSIGVTIEDD